MVTDDTKSTPGFASSRSSKWKWLAVAILGLVAHNAKAAQAVDPTHQNNSWLQEHLLNSNAQLPFSFVYGRQSSRALLKAWPEKTATRKLDGRRTEHTLVWTDPKTGLQVRLTAVDYRGLSRRGVDGIFQERRQGRYAHP